MSEFFHWVVEPFTDIRAFWIITVASLVNISSAMLGSYLVLRRMSLMGDAISHAVLPGLVLAFMITGSLGVWFMFGGALAMGLLTAVFTQALHRLGGVQADAALGVVFTSLFAFGVVLLHLFTAKVDLDVNCVLYGQLGAVDITTQPIFGVEVPEQAMLLAPVLLINLIVVTLFWKELKISSFDPALSTTMGFSADWMHYLLMGLVALTTVASFQAVGSILVVAMLIAPAATAHLLSDRLGPMMLIGAGLGVLSAVIGYWLYIVTDSDAAGMMAVSTGAIYGLAVLFAPRYGVASSLLRNLSTSLRILREDLLAMLYRLEELAVTRRMGGGEAIHAVGGGILARIALLQLMRRRRVQSGATGLELTDDGRARARSLLRSHRLWETYLHEQLNLPLDHVHNPAERMEHFIGDDLRERIAKELTDSARDPHGREIPE